MTGSSLPLHVQKDNMLISTLENQELHTNRFEDPIRAWLKSILLETPIDYRILNAQLLDCKYALSIQIGSHQVELIALSFDQDLDTFPFVNKMISWLLWKFNYT